MPYVGRLFASPSKAFKVLDLAEAFATRKNSQLIKLRSAKEAKVVNIKERPKSKLLVIDNEDD